MPAVPRPSPADAFDLPDLGQLDKSDESDDVDVGVFELSLGDDAESPEDSATVDTFEVDIQVLTDSGSNEAASDLDIGDAGLVDTLPLESDEPDGELAQAPGSELDEHLEAPLESDDPSSAAELGDDGLEELHALVNEEGDGDAGPDVERAFLPSAPEGKIPDARRYEVEWLLLGSPCGALAASGESVLAAAPHLMRFGQERRSDHLPLGARASSLTVVEQLAVLATTRGLIEVTASGAVALAETPELSRGSGAEIIELAAAEGSATLWARLSNGMLLRRRAGLWERHHAEGEVRSLHAHGQRLTLLVDSHRPSLQLSSDGGSSFRELLLPEPARTVALGLAALSVSQDNVVAVADAERGLCVSNDGGQTFRMVTGAVNVSAVTLGMHAGSLAVFAALHREGKDLTDLVVVDPATGAGARIAELSAAPEEDTEETGRTSALLFADGCLWSAGGYGLARLRAATLAPAANLAD